MRSSDTIATSSDQALDWVWSRAGGVLTRSTARRLILLGPGDAEPVCLTGGGIDVWTLLEEPITARELTAVLAEAYAEDAGAVSSDVTRVLEDLAERGLAVRSPS